MKFTVKSKFVPKTKKLKGMTVMSRIQTIEKANSLEAEIKRQIKRNNSKRRKGKLS